MCYCGGNSRCNIIVWKESSEKRNPLIPFVSEFFVNM